MSNNMSNNISNIISNFYFKLFQIISNFKIFFFHFCLFRDIIHQTGY